MTTALVERLVADLAAEKADLVAVLRGLLEQRWHTPTPAPGWTVRDQVAHLAHFDDITAMAIAEPAQFVAWRDSVADLPGYVDSVGAAQGDRDGAALLQWWDDTHGRLAAAALAADPTVRVPWFGPPMSLASKLTARLMESWAHGQDVVDALGATRRPTDRLEHIARIGVLALPNSFRARNLPVPQTPVRVELTAPDGRTTWSWGPADADQLVRGEALDFCLVATQRRHVADTDLVAVGQAATTWLTIAQAFAGPPGRGRRPGQFRR